MTTTSAQVKAYRRTFPGFLTLVYANQKMTSKKAQRPPPAYTKIELGEWLQKQPNFQALWDSWVASDYDRDLSPSVDRINPKIPYIISNIRLVTFRKNHQNQVDASLSGEYLNTNAKAVRQLDMDGNLIAVYPSVSLALRTIGANKRGVTNVSAVADGKWLTAYGFKWEWA